MANLVKTPFGLHLSGRMISAHEAEQGIACNCVCPSCKSPLVANQGQIKAWHFSHHATSNCRHAGETAIHVMAKQIIADHCHIVLPTYTGLKQYKKKLEQVQLEELIKCPLGDIRPDVLCRAENDDLLIEIAVAHFANKEKINRICLIGIPTVEITIPRLNNGNEWDIKSLEYHVLESIEHKKWIYKPSTLPKIEIVNETTVYYNFSLMISKLGEDGHIRISEIITRPEGGYQVSTEWLGKFRFDYLIELDGNSLTLSVIAATIAKSLGGELEHEHNNWTIRSIKPGALLELIPSICLDNKVSVFLVNLRSERDIDNFSRDWGFSWKNAISEIDKRNTKEQDNEVITKLAKLQEILSTGKRNISTL